MSITALSMAPNTSVRLKNPTNTESSGCNCFLVSPGGKNLRVPVTFRSPLDEFLHADASVEFASVTLMAHKAAKSFLSSAKLPNDAGPQFQKDTLLKAFGSTPEKEFSKLVSKRFVLGDDDDSDIFGTIMRELYAVTFGDATITKDKLSQMIVWNSLPNSQEQEI